MRETRQIVNDEDGKKLMVDILGLQKLLSCGMVTANKIANQAGASIKIGKRRLYNVEKIKAYINEMGA